MSQKLEIPYSCLRRLIRKDNSERFTIHIKVGTKERRKTINFVTTINKARVLSKKINEIYEIDPTITEYEIILPTKKDENLEEDEIINIFKNLEHCMEETINVSNDKYHEYKRMLFLLGSEDENSGDHGYEIGSIEEAISLLNTEYHSQSIEYMSNHFLNIVEDGRVKNIEDEIVYEIIDGYIENSKENSKEIEAIFDSLKNQGERDEVIVHFLLQVDDCSISNRNDMIEFLIDNFNDEIIDQERSLFLRFIRRQLCSQIHNQNQETEQKQKQKQETVSVEFEGNELNGIISYLTKKKEEENNGEEALKLSGGGRPNPSLPITNLIKYDQSHINDDYNNYFTKPKPNSTEGWIEFDFGERKVNLTSYTLRTSEYGLNSYYHAKTWRIVGSNNGKEWDDINRQTNNSSLNSSYKQHRFECEHTNKYYRYIRYIQDDSWCSQREHCVWFTCIEFFGSILLP